MCVAVGLLTATASLKKHKSFASNYPQWREALEVRLYSNGKTRGRVAEGGGGGAVGGEHLVYSLERREGGRDGRGG